MREMRTFSLFSFTLVLCGFIQTGFGNELLTIFQLIEPLKQLILSNSRIPASALKDIHILDFISLVNRHGYPAEEHQVVTEDGYRLRIHRIPGSPSSPPAHGKPVVYIQHGICSSSDAFVLTGPNKDLAFILADAGYDVWLGNVRGNTYSRSHIYMSPDSDPQFWKFSQQEMGFYDASAIVDLILKVTSKKTLVFIGHSMGTTLGLILLSTRPEYNDKISLVVNLASIGFWKRPRNFIALITTFGEILMKMVHAFEIQEVFSQSTLFGVWGNTTCGPNSPLLNLCLKLNDFMSGSSTDFFDSKLFSEVFFHFPAGASIQTFIHYYQNIKAGKLQMYDYGILGNWKNYRQNSPPLYNLDRVMTPVYMIYGKTDAVATSEDTLDLIHRLRHSRAESVPSERFGHLDFVWGKNIKVLLNDRILQIIEYFERNKGDIESL